MGNIDTITDAKGDVVQRAIFDAFGKQTVTYTTLDKTWTNRGFTGHEHLQEFNLIHMNGRIYDPELSRFISADPYIQSPTMSQSYNRYAYVLNNQMKYTDPSGYLRSGEGGSVNGVSSGEGSSGSDDSNKGYDYSDNNPGYIEVGPDYGQDGASDITDQDLVDAHNQYNGGDGGVDTQGGWSDYGDPDYGGNGGSDYETVTGGPANWGGDNSSSSGSGSSSADGSGDSWGSGDSGDDPWTGGEGSYSDAHNDPSYADPDDVFNGGPWNANVEARGNANAAWVAGQIAGLVPIVKAGTIAKRGYDAAKKSGIVGRGATKSGITLSQAKNALRKGHETDTGGVSRFGQQLEKHMSDKIGRNPAVWGGGPLKGNNHAKSRSGYNQFREIFNGPGSFAPKPNQNGTVFLEKMLPDGRGVRLNRDGAFKGFVE